MGRLPSYPAICRAAMNCSTLQLTPARARVLLLTILGKMQFLGGCRR
jgi:hypothetical protein